MIRGGKTDANLPYEAKSLQIKAAVYIASMILAGAAKCVNILLDGNVRLETLIEGDGTTAAVVTSPVPWFGTVAFALTVIYIFISLLFFGSMKEELTGGYHDR